MNYIVQKHHTVTIVTGLLANQTNTGRLNADNFKKQTLLALLASLIPRPSVGQRQSPKNSVINHSLHASILLQNIIHMHFHCVNTGTCLAQIKSLPTSTNESVQQTRLKKNGIHSLCALGAVILVVGSLVPSRPRFFSLPVRKSGFSYWKRKKAGTAGYEARWLGGWPIPCCVISSTGFSLTAISICLHFFWTSYKSLTVFW